MDGLVSVYVSDRRGTINKASAKFGIFIDASAFSQNASASQK